MKKYILISFCMLFAAALYASPTSENDTTAQKKPVGKWAISSTPAFTINEKLFNNWSAAGNSLISFVANFDGQYKYSHPKYIVDNICKLALGADLQDLNDNRSLESRRKTADQIDITSTYSRKIYSWMNLNASVNFKSQFVDGKNYAGAGNEEGTLVSRFMAPGYLTTSVGYEYKTDYWNGSLSFLSGKTTFLLSEDVIAAGQLYGVDTTGGKRVYQALGTYVKLYFKKDIFKDFNLYGRVELFYDYRKPSLVNWDDQPQYDTKFRRLRRCIIHETDVNFELTVNYKVAKSCTLNASLNMKYDTDFAGTGQYGHWQMYQTAGLRFFLNHKWATPE